MGTLPSDVLSAIYKHLPILNLLKIRLLNHKHKDVADNLLSQPNVVLQIIGSKIDIEKVKIFLNYYRQTPAFKKLLNVPTEKLSCTEAFCKALTTSNDEILKNAQALIESKHNEQLTDPETFIRLIDTMFWPNLGSESGRIMALIRYFRTTEQFKRLESMVPSDMNEFDVLCYSLTATDVTKIPLERLGAVLELRKKMDFNDNEGLRNCIKSLEMSYRILIDKSNVTGTMQSRRKSEKSFLNLPGIELTNLSLSNINLSGANLEGANFSGTTIKSVAFSYTQLRNTDFSKTKFIDKIEMTGADIRKVKLGDNDLSHAQLAGALLLSDITLESLQQFPFNKKTAKALSNEILRLVGSEPEAQIARAKLQLALEKLSWDSYPKYKVQLLDEANELERRSAKKDPMSNG